MSSLGAEMAGNLLPATVAVAAIVSAVVFGAGRLRPPRLLPVPVRHPRVGSLGQTPSSPERTTQS